MEDISYRKLLAFFQSTFLFKGISKEKLGELITKINPHIASFVPDELIYSPEQFRKKMGFVYTGECVVERVKSEHAPIILNSLSRYDSFGVLALFSDADRFPTTVRARRASTVLFLDRDEVVSLIEADSQIAVNLLEFMGDRINFLNTKIATFSGDNVEQKVVAYLLEQRQMLGGTFKLNCKKASETINVGRASLYRVLSVLTLEGLIKFENKIIFINDPDGLERKLK